MKINNVFSGRPAYYDRNPSVPGDFGFYSTGVAPHALTTRFTYTVPNGRKAFVSYLAARSLRETAATTAGQVQARIGYTRAGGAQVFLMASERIDNTLTVADQAVSPTELVMQAADNLLGSTADLSVAGTVDYLIAAIVVEFDA